jgi:glycosyltransferase involved in cell wall biosynthesis
MNEIAVTIPCYNHGATVGQALDSVLAQTRPAVEIIIVDDGSTDLHTRQVLASLEKPRTRIVHTPNGGAAAARNHGIRLTSAPYIVTLDADDMLDPVYLEKTAGRLDARPDLGFVSTAIQTFEGASYIWTPPPCSLVNALTRGSAHVTSMFRRRLWEAVGGFDEAFSTAEDLDFWISAMEEGFRGEVIDEPLLRCRVRADSKHRRNVDRGGYRTTIEAILHKHRRTIENVGPEFLLAKESFILEQRAHLRALEVNHSVLTEELARLEEERGKLTRSLREHGKEPIDWGDLRRLEPVSPVWGIDRGKPVDRYYIDAFLDKHRSDIRGHVLEVKDAGYTERLGGEQVTKSEVLDIDRANPRATIIADLSKADVIPSDLFDCFILTQTLQYIYDFRAAVSHACRILKPGGVLLCTLPSVSRIDREYGSPDGGDYWRFTEASTRALFSEVFPLEAFNVTGFGNVMTCAAFLYGLSQDEVKPAELDYVDHWSPLLFCVRAVKPISGLP